MVGDWVCTSEYFESSDSGAVGWDSGHNPLEVNGLGWKMDMGRTPQVVRRTVELEGTLWIIEPSPYQEGMGGIELPDSGSTARYLNY